MQPIKPFLCIIPLKQIPTISNLLNITNFCPTDIFLTHKTCHLKLHTPSSNVPLIISIKWKAKYGKLSMFCAVTILLFHIPQHTKFTIYTTTLNFRATVPFMPQKYILSPCWPYQLENRCTGKETEHNQL